MQEISHLQCALLLIYLLGRERELESTAPLPFSTSGNMFKFLSFHSAHRPFRDIALAGQKPGKPVAGRIFVLIDYQSTLRTRIRPLPHRHVLLIATLRATLGRISLAEVVHPVAVALCLALDHLHELVQASFILHAAVQPLDSYAGFPRFLHHRWLRPSAEDDRVFIRSGHKSRGFGQEVALLSPFLLRYAKNHVDEISVSPRTFLALTLGERGMIRSPSLVGQKTARST